jgi:6-phosphogluconolactonase
MGAACLVPLIDSPARDAIDWSQLHVWWGDERFLPRGHADRNETQARESLLDHVPLDPAHVHAMPSSEGGLDVDSAAAEYAEELRRHSRPEDHARLPRFDVCLLGIGPDAHVASLFPQAPALHETERTVVGVHSSPKPPPVRISLTLPALATASEIWIIADGGGKADALRLALSGAGPVQVPAAGARGRERTLVIIDEAAASALPPEIRRIASP